MPIALLASSFAGVRAGGSDQLVMFQERGCPYCAAWDRKVGTIYAKTDEAKVFPLRRVDIRAKRPADLRAIAGIRYTPTFIVMHCGREFRRITGYTSDDQFWGLLDEAVRGAAANPDCAGH